MSMRNRLKRVQADLGAVRCRNCGAMLLAGAETEESTADQAARLSKWVYSNICRTGPDAAAGLMRWAAHALANDDDELGRRVLATIEQYHRETRPAWMATAYEVFDSLEVWFSMDVLQEALTLIAQREKNRSASFSNSAEPASTVPSLDEAKP